jgi:cytidylate kinase
MMLEPWMPGLQINADDQGKTTCVSSKFCQKYGQSIAKLGKIFQKYAKCHIFQ